MHILDHFRAQAALALVNAAKATGAELDASACRMLFEVPPQPDLGDIAFPCFSLSKSLRQAPQSIAKELAEAIAKEHQENHLFFSAISCLGPYVNFTIRTSKLAQLTLGHQERQTNDGKKELILIESPGPNTNKPLHLGHLRNILLGSSITNILRAAGKDARIVNVVNDRGVHICKSMLAYQKFGGGKTPQSEHRKPDHFVGDYYVLYSKSEKEHPEFEQEVQDMLVRWEQGDPQVRALWKTMNKWAMDGWKDTYQRLGFSIEKEYYESETYTHGKEIILDGLQKGIFGKDDDGNIILDASDKGLGKKVLLRSNGTSVYITQDIFMAKKRFDDYRFEGMVYVVANEQEYHFKVLFEVFARLGWQFAPKCFHFSYGMVELPEGKMKSREGNVIDTDDILDSMHALAEEELKQRYPDLDNDELKRRSEAISLAAIRFFFLRQDPLRNFVFNPKESLSFEGDTGPYVQYAYARIQSIFAKAESEIHAHPMKTNLSLLDTQQDKQLLTLIASYDDKVLEAATNYRPSIIAYYVLDIAKAFSSYYHDQPILKADSALRDSRLALLDAVADRLKSGLSLLGIQTLEKM